MVVKYVGDMFPSNIMPLGGFAFSCLQGYMPENPNPLADVAHGKEGELLFNVDCGDGNQISCNNRIITVGSVCTGPIDDDLKVYMGPDWIEYSELRNYPQANGSNEKVWFRALLMLQRSRARVNLVWSETLPDRQVSNEIKLEIEANWDESGDISFLSPVWQHTLASSIDLVPDNGRIMAWNYPGFPQEVTNPKGEGGQEVFHQNFWSELPGVWEILRQYHEFYYDMAIRKFANLTPTV